MSKKMTVKKNSPVIEFWKRRVKSLNMMHDGLYGLAKATDALTNLQDRAKSKELLGRLHKDFDQLDNLLDSRDQ